MDLVHAYIEDLEFVEFEDGLWHFCEFVIADREIFKIDQFSKICRQFSQLTTIELD